MMPPFFHAHRRLGAVVIGSLLTWTWSLADDPLASVTPAGSEVTFGIHSRCRQLDAVASSRDGGAGQPVRVVVCPMGGRVLEFSLGGRNALFVSDHDAATVPRGAISRWANDPSAGRFDVGPEMILPKRPETWKGDWQLSQPDANTILAASPIAATAGLQLQRRFELSVDPVTLRCTQTIRNVSDRTIDCCHWSRTLANGAGRLIIPKGDIQQFPEHYLRYDQGVLTIRPRDPAVVDRGDFLILTGPPASSKLAFDSMAGWVAHLQDSGLVFVKVFPVDPAARYGEVAGFPLATWTPPTGETIEIEPIGPMQRLAPGRSASLTEVWGLTENPQEKTEEISLPRVLQWVSRWQ